MKRRRRRKNKPNPFIWIILAAAGGLSIFLLTRGIKPTAPRQARKASEAHARSHLDSMEVTEHFRQVVGQAGGNDVWIRSTRQPARVPDAGNSIEVLASPRAYKSALNAIQHEAREEHLMPHLKEASLPGGFSLSEIALYSGPSPVCYLQLREVPLIARVAIVMDDLGQNPEAAQELLGTRAALTFSVMPQLPYSRQTAEAAHQVGVEVMLHLPMQPLANSAPDVSPREIREGMDGEEVTRTIENDLASVPWVAGVNNHMGSRATEDAQLMTEVMTALRRRQLYFVDSRTTPDSVALKVARSLSVPSFYRSVFLDDVRTVPYTVEQLRKLCRIAERQGAALAIGHPYPTTLAALKQFLPNLERENIELVPVSHLLRLPEVARLSPPAPREVVRRAD